MNDDDMMMESKKQCIKLTESELKNIIAESVKNILNEEMWSSPRQNDIETLKKIYELTIQIEDIAENGWFGNSPIIDGTSMIKKYCQSQMQRLS